MKKFIRQKSVRYLWNRADKCPPEHYGNITKAFNEWILEKDHERACADIIIYKRITRNMEIQRKAYNQTMKELNQ